MDNFVHGDERFLTWPLNKEFTIAFAIQLSYGVPSLFKYVVLLKEIVDRGYFKLPFYKLFLIDGVFVSIFLKINS